MPELSIDLTQWVGIAVFAAAAIACLAASRVRPVAWRLLAALQVSCCVEVVWGVRYQLHNEADLVLQGQGRYEGCHPLQLTPIGIVLLLAVAGAAGIVWRARRLNAGLAGALLGTLLTGALFDLETVSLHDIDATMYAVVGPIKAIDWMWAGVAAITIASAVRGARESAGRR